MSVATKTISFFPRNVRFGDVEIDRVFSLVPYFDLDNRLTSVLIKTRHMELLRDREKITLELTAEIPDVLKARQIGFSEDCWVPCSFGPMLLERAVPSCNPDIVPHAILVFRPASA